MKKYSTNVLLTIFVLISACSSSDDSQGVISVNNLSSDTTVTTITEEVDQEIISPEDAQLLLARC
jgi:major membrane immunogen (membrane-anchored lipoprotein)